MIACFITGAISLGLQEDPLLVAGQQAERLRRCGRSSTELRPAGLLERGQVGGDRHHHPEDASRRPRGAEPEQHAEHAQLADPHARADRLLVQHRDGGALVGLGLGRRRRRRGGRGGRGAARRARARRRGRGGRRRRRSAVAGRVRRLGGGTAARPRAASRGEVAVRVGVALGFAHAWATSPPFPGGHPDPLGVRRCGLRAGLEAARTRAARGARH